MEIYFDEHKYISVTTYCVHDLCVKKTELVCKQYGCLGRGVICSLLVSHKKCFAPYVVKGRNLSSPMEKTRLHMHFEFRIVHKWYVWQKNHNRLAKANTKIRFVTM